MSVDAARLQPSRSVSEEGTGVEGVSCASVMGQGLTSQVPFFEGRLFHRSMTPAWLRTLQTVVGDAATIPSRSSEVSRR